MADVAVGIAGWSYEDWKGVVYPRGCRDTLRFCAGFVDCIEINSSFYHTPAVHTVASWVRRTEDLDVFFTAKLEQSFTHRLEISSGAVAQVRDSFAPLVAAGKLRALLAQFNFRFPATEEHIGHLAALVGAFADFVPIAVEVRHKTWEEPTALQALRELDVSVVHLDYPGQTSGFGLRRTGLHGVSDLAYFRLHGRNHAAWFDKAAGRDEVYDYDYSPGEVKHLVDRVIEVAATARETVVVANNHFHGQGMKTALEMSAALRGERVPVPADLLRVYPTLGACARDARRGLFD